MPTQAELAEINRVAQPLLFDAADYDRLLDEIGDARVVLIGEASHGTHDFYRERIRITQRLIEERGAALCRHEIELGDLFVIDAGRRFRARRESLLSAQDETRRNVASAVRASGGYGVADAILDADESANTGADATRIG